MLEKITHALTNVIGVVLEITVLAGPLTWAYRIIRLLLSSDSHLNPLARQYVFKDAMRGFAMMLLYIVGLLGLIYSFKLVSWLSYVCSAISFLCGYVGNRIFNYLDRKEQLFYRKAPKRKREQRY